MGEVWEVNYTKLTLTWMKMKAYLGRARDEKMETIEKNDATFEYMRECSMSFCSLYYCRAWTPPWRRRSV